MAYAAYFSFIFYGFFHTLRTLTVQNTLILISIVIASTLLFFLLEELPNLPPQLQSKVKAVLFGSIAFPMVAFPIFWTYSFLATGTPTSLFEWFPLVLCAALGISGLAFAALFLKHFLRCI